MKNNLIYLLVRDEPYGFGELLGMLRRQNRADYLVIALIPSDLGDATKKLVSDNLDISVQIANNDVGAAIMSDLVTRDADSVTILDSTFIPSNQVWFDRLITKLEKENQHVVMGRLVNDLYTNWLIQNDFRVRHHMASQGVIDPFLFQYSVFAISNELLIEKPFPSGDIDEFRLKWFFDIDPSEIKFVPDSTVTHLLAIEQEDYALAYQNYVRFSKNRTENTISPISDLFKSLSRDISFSFSKRKPQWILYSILFRLRIFFTMLK